MKNEEGLTLISAEFKKKMRSVDATFWAKHLGDDLYEMRHPPACIPNLNYGDIVRAIKIEGRTHPLITELIKKSGYKTILMFFLRNIDDSEKESVLKKLDEFDVLYKMGPKNFYVLSISPEQDYSAICKYLESLKENDLIEYDTANDVGGFSRAWSK